MEQNNKKSKENKVVKKKFDFKKRLSEFKSKEFMKKYGASVYMSLALMAVVATAVGGVPDMITDGEDGVLCNNTPQDIAAALEKVIESEELRRKIGQNAVKTSEKYSSDETARKYYELYCKCIKK